MNADQPPRAEDSTREPLVKVTVLHGGFDRATYTLMIPVYVDEEMSGAERFLDGQFGQLLSAWRDRGRYPGGLGTSLFVEPGVYVEDCEPPGAYLLGVGSSLTLDRRRLRFAVRSALLDRCLRLYPAVRPDLGKSKESNDETPALTPVGVSSALLGVRDDESLRVEDSVAGILEGVDDTNEALSRFEEDRGPMSQVRVTHVEFVERYADRANLAASAIRQLHASEIGTRFASLDRLVVTSKDGDGALPIGASLLEQDRPWRRFLVAERQTSDTESSPDDQSRPLVVEVSALGRDARADRVTHRIDRASLDALVTRVSNNRGNEAALKALRDRLVPYALRTEFLTTAAIQIIVDASTANYPWELLAGTALSTEGHEPTGTASVLRMFTEASDRRLHVDRAMVDTALVIGAGKVDLEGFPPIPEAITEAEGVRDLLKSKGVKTDILTDDKRPLDVADLNIQLCGDHQVLHIASHGIHVEGDRDATGAVLAKNLRFTEDLIESLPRVPELVVVNSCYNASIGSKLGDLATSTAGFRNPRMAAGLARALMGIGVRAVVAAGWPVDDRAAREFALTLYGQLTAGHTFGEAVSRARASAAAYSGTSWAAYQCYGDPTFVLRGHAQEPALGSDPVSVSDLKARLGALRTRVADIGRPKPGGPRDRRPEHRATFKNLRDWVEREYAKGKTAGEWEGSVPHEVRRELALTARELADFDAAAFWYGTFAIVPTDGTPARPSGQEATARDLREAANCLARSAREGAADPGLFPRAVALAEGAKDMLPDDQSWSILASVHKKWATVEKDRDVRMEHLKHAAAAYAEVRSAKPGDYGVENGIQVIAASDIESARRRYGEVHSTEPDDCHAAQPERTDAAPIVDEGPPRGADYWERARPGDCELSWLMVAPTAKEREAARDGVITKYIHAFQRRSTYSERLSSWDHLHDLSEMLRDDDDRKALLAAASAELGKYLSFTPTEAPPAPRAASAAREMVAEKANSRLQGIASRVQVKAFHAGPGDCLLLEYTGTDDSKHRMLVDGGVESAFESGLAQALGTPGAADNSVDLAVVTHIDADHLAGVIRALEDKRLDAKQFWFNGRAQIADLIDGRGTRSTAQGDALSKLIPDGKRNLVVQGGALVVPDSGPNRLQLPGGASVVLLSPSQVRLQELLDKWPKTRGDVGSIEDLIRALADEATRAPGVFGKDDSVTNGSSIAFLFEHDGVSILLTGDALAPELEKSIQAVLDEREETRLKVTLFKLPHHGSRQNITDHLLSLIEPEQILICTNGSGRSRHPDEDALMKVREAYPDALIHFTDNTGTIKERARAVGLEVPTSSPVTIDL